MEAFYLTLAIGGTVMMSMFAAAFAAKGGSTSLRQPAASASAAEWDT
jgi:hypothetical protein